MTEVAKSLDPRFLVDLQKMWERKLAAMKATDPVPASVSSGHKSGSGATPSASRPVRMFITTRKPGCGPVPVTVPSHALRGSFTILVNHDET